jgi:hypothetical protein
LIIFGLLALPVQVGADSPRKPKPHVGDLEASLDGDRYLVSYTLEETMTPEVEERVHSGIPVKFKHRVEVKLKRGFPVLVDKVLSRVVVESGVKYDTLTRQYELWREIEQRPRKKGRDPAIEEQRRATDSLDEMRAWMTRLERVPVLRPVKEQPIEKLRVRVEVVLGRSYVMWIFPTTDSVAEEIPLEP